MTEKLNSEDIYSWLLLALTPRVGPITMLKLINYFGSPKVVFEQSISSLEKIVTHVIAKLIVDKSAAKEVDKSLEWVNSNNNCSLITINDTLYPHSLKEISDPPLILYLRGNKNLLNSNKLAIVGSRYPTTEGTENAFKFAHDLSNNGLTITSGMAKGIDRYAHIGGLKGQSSTIGVIGTGINVNYPETNHDLYNKVIENGLLISEFPLDTPPAARNFPRRNRIIAGLSLGCLVIESTIDSGSLISANFALEMGREVMAIPSSINNPLARGCHKLIKEGAKLIESTNDVLEELRFDKKYLEKRKISLEITSTDSILGIIGYKPTEIDTLCSKLNLNFSDICDKLLELELNGSIINCGENKYQKVFK